MDSVANLSKEEFLKFLNCSAPPQKVTYTLRNRETTFIKRKGKCTALNLTVVETALDNKVLRVPLPRIDLKGLSKREVNLIFNNTLKRKRSARQVSSYGRKLIRKKRFHLEDKKSKKPNNQNKRNTLATLLSSVRTRRSVDESTKLRDYSRTNKNSIISPKQSKQSINENIRITRSASKPVQAVLTRSKQQQKIDASKNKSNGALTKPDRSKKSAQLKTYSGNITKTYYLSFSKPKDPVDGKLNYTFEKLVLDIKDVLLPGPHWKIKVIVRSNKITSIVFTNKCVVERSVTFSANSKYFSVVIDNKPAILLGAPKGVNNIRDIEVLLDIVHNISARNLMVLYK